MIDQRGRLLIAALGFAGCSMLSYDRALQALRSWLDCWSGIGHVAVGMARRRVTHAALRPGLAGVLPHVEDKLVQARAPSLGGHPPRRAHQQ